MKISVGPFGGSCALCPVFSSGSCMWYGEREIQTRINPIIFVYLCSSCKQAMHTCSFICTCSSWDIRCSELSADVRGRTFPRENCADYHVPSQISSSILCVFFSCHVNQQYGLFVDLCPLLSSSSSSALRTSPVSATTSSASCLCSRFRSRLQAPSRSH
jgi:hypothetical protein